LSNDIEVLHDFHDSLSAPNSTEVNAVKIIDPLDAVEQSIGDFVSDSLKLVSKRHSFEEELQDSVREVLPEASFQQRADLYMDQQRINNDMTTRIIQPFSSIAVEKAKARVERGELGQGGGEGGSGDATFQKAPKEILQGLTALNQLLEIATAAAAAKKTGS